jgi:hypothetical protein
MGCKRVLEGKNLALILNIEWENFKNDWRLLQFVEV